MITAENIALATTAASTLFAFCVFIYKKLIKPTKQFVEEVKHCQEEVRESIKIIRAEVQTNGGSSIKDAVNDLKDTCVRIERNQKVLDQRSKASLHYHEHALFEVDPDGRIKWHNEKLKAAFGNEGIGVIEGYDWISIIEEDERIDFIKEFSSCLEMCRKVDIETVSVNGSKIHFIGYPYRVTEDDHEGFLIHLYKEN